MSATETFTDTCSRCGRIEAFPEPASDLVDYWTLGPDGWLVIAVDWDGYLACRGDACTFSVLYVCPACVTEEDQDAPHMSWRLQSGTGTEGQ